MYTRVSTSPTPTTLTDALTDALTATPSTPSTATSTKELTMRIDPSDILFAVLALALLLAAALVLGGMAAHPFAG